MKLSEDESKECTFQIKINGLKIPEEKRTNHELEARQMTLRADSLGLMDPLDEGLSLIFDARS